MRDHRTDRDSTPVDITERMRAVAARSAALAFIDLPPLDRPAWTTVGRLMMAPVVENRS